MMKLVRFFHPELGTRLGILLENTVHDVTTVFPSITGWLQNSSGRVEDALYELQVAAQKSEHRFPASLFENLPASDVPHWLAPVDYQDVWAAGVTYERSRAARQEEALDGGDVYARVYNAERPELFFKAHAAWVIGQYGEVGIRADATWSVPEPELALVINPAMQVVGFTIGNDMSSRDIEGANPLYLPQAKIYTAACALGPSILLQPTTEWLNATIRIRIQRAKQVVFEGDVSTARIRRTIPELVEFLGRSTSYPNGVVLLTGTGVVPPGEFTLAASDVIEITIDGIGTLKNTVKVV